MKPPLQEYREFPHKSDDNRIEMIVIREMNRKCNGSGRKTPAMCHVEIEYIGYLCLKNNQYSQFIKYKEILKLGKQQNIKQAYVRRVVGLEMAITANKIGSRIHVWIPHKLAYGMLCLFI